MSKPEEPQPKNGKGNGGSFLPFGPKVSANTKRGGLAAVVALAVLSILKNELGVHFSAETMGLLIILIQTWLGADVDKEK